MADDVFKNVTKNYHKLYGGGSWRDNVFVTNIFIIKCDDMTKHLWQIQLSLEGTINSYVMKYYEITWQSKYCINLFNIHT
jgi:hypothetical protein